MLELVIVVDVPIGDGFAGLIANHILSSESTFRAEDLLDEGENRLADKESGEGDVLVLWGSDHKPALARFLDRGTFGDFVGELEKLDAFISAEDVGDDGVTIAMESFDDFLNFSFGERLGFHKKE